MSGHERGLSASCVAENGLDILVATLVGFPVAVSEGLWDLVDVELFDESLVGIGFRGWRGHIEFEFGLNTVGNAWKWFDCWDVNWKREHR